MTAPKKGTLEAAAMMLLLNINGADAAFKREPGVGLTLRDGLKETPDRFARSWEFLTSGYRVRPEQVLKEFADGGEHYDEMVVVSNIPVYSLCEHHLLPFFGVAHVAYIPSGKVVGLSKIPRLVEVFMRRLQVQERLTAQIAEALQQHLKPKGVGVILQCRHLCIEMRGVERANTMTTTSKLLGTIKQNAQVRAEFLALKQGKA